MELGVLQNGEGEIQAKRTGLWNVIQMIFKGEIRNSREMEKRERIGLQNMHIMLASVIAALSITQNIPPENLKQRHAAPEK